MTGPENRDVLNDQMTRFVFDEMDDAERHTFERLVASDPALAKEIQRLRRTLDLVPFAVAETPPASVRRQLLGKTVQRHPAARPSTWAWVLAAAASLLAGILLFQNRQLDRELVLQREVAQLLQEPNITLAFALRGSSADTGAFGRVILDLDAKKGAVVIRRLPPLAEGQLYRLWAIVAGKPVRCGDFNANEEQEIRRVFPIPVDAYTAPVSSLILTVEPDADLEAPLGPTIMRGS